MHIDDVFNEFVLANRAEGKSPRTLDTYQWQYKRFKKWVDEHDIPTDVTKWDAGTFRQFITYMQEADYAPQTVTNQVKMLRRLFNFARLDELIENNPTERVKPPKVPEEPVEHLDDEDVSQLIKACELASPTGARNAAIIMLMYDTGIRASELVALTKGDLDVPHGKLVVRGKGSKVRVLPLSPNTARAITHYLRKIKSPEDEATPLFLSERGGPLTRFGLAQMLKSLGRQTGLEVHPHKLRHSFAVAALRNGAREYDIQDVLGHTTLQMTKRYAKQTDADLARAHERFSPAKNIR